MEGEHDLRFDDSSRPVRMVQASLTAVLIIVLVVPLVFLNSTLTMFKGLPPRSVLAALKELADGLILAGWSTWKVITVNWQDLTEKEKQACDV